MRAVAALFLVKASVLALFVTPLWDVPDESGHYAIVADLADGRGLPLPGRSVLPDDVAADWGKGRVLAAQERWNWVAQHPPLYHLLAVPFLEVARAVTPDPHWRYRAPRLLSALSGAATLLVLFAVFFEGSGDPMFALAAASAFGFLPMFTHMSSGTNHDVFLAFLCGLAALFWVRLARTGRFADGLKMGLALAAAGATKLSAIPVAAALLLFAWTWLESGGVRRVRQWIAIAAVSVSAPALWALRQWLILGNARLHPVSKKPFSVSSFFHYLRDYPVVDHTFKNFLGLIGWTASGAGNVRWFQISGFYLGLYAAIAFAGASAAAIWLWEDDRGKGRLGRAAFLLVFASCALWLFATAEGTSPAKRVLYALLAAAPFLALPGLFSRRGAVPDRLLRASHGIVLLFSLAYLVNSWEAFEIYGSMRATNGRYFFAVLAFLGLAFLFPLARLWPPSFARNALFVALLAALAADETTFFLLKVIPFYRGA